MCIAVLLSAAISQAAPADARRAPFVVTTSGKPAATIVLARKAAPSAEFAAQELREHIRRISGAVLPIVRDDRSVKGRRILVGDSEPVRKLGVRVASLRSQERLVRVGADTIVLVGKDSDTEQPPASTSREPGRAKGKFGRALVFDGRTTVTSVPDFPFPSAEGTLEAWVYMKPENPECDGTVLRCDGDGPWTYHILQRPAGTRAMEYRLYDGKTVTAVRSPDLTAGWHHVVATHSRAAGMAELFVDGRSQGTTAFGVTKCQGATLGIGAMPPGSSGATVPGNPLDGMLDEVLVLAVVRAPTGVPEKPSAVDASTRLLLHGDEESGRPIDATGRADAVPLPGFFSGNGTLMAVYDFLERQCGVRWYAPGDLGTVVPAQPTLKVEPVAYRRTPSMSYRWITPTALYMPTPDDRVSARENDLWRLRNRLGGLPYAATHSFEGYYNRFLTSHPEWFARGYSGRPPQMCYTDPEFIAQVVQDARDYFDGKGAKQGAAALGDYFALVPMDNMSWCKCERCQAMINRAEENNPQFNNGKASEYIWHFVNAVAREVRKTHPRRWIAALAYSDYAYAPREPIEPNVAVQLCLHVRNWFCPSMEVNDLKVLREFTQDPRRPVFLWLYYNFPALQAQYDGYRTFPSFFASTLLRQMPMYQRAGIRGMFIEHSSEFGQSHMGDVPDLWLTLKLADDATLDGKALYDEFFRLFYGAAAEPMRALYEAIEAAYGTPANYPAGIRLSPGHQHQTRELAWKHLGTPERMAQFARLMDQARAAARTDEEKKRVELFERGIWQPMLEGAAAWAREHP